MAVIAMDTAAVNLSAAKSKPMMEMNTTPLIDVLRGLRRNGTENLHKGSGQPKTPVLMSNGNGSKVGGS